MQTFEELRPRIVQAAAHGHAGLARGLAARLWHSAPTLAAAGFLGKTLPGSPAAAAWPRRRVFVLRSFTVEPIIPALVAEGLAAGVVFDVTVGDFNAYSQELLDPASRLYAADPDVAILAVQTRDIAPELWAGTAARPAAYAAAVDRVTAELTTLVEAFRGRSARPLVLHGLDLPVHATDGIGDYQRTMGQINAVRQINRRLVELAAGKPEVYVLDYDRLVARHGSDRWYDERLWASARLPLNPVLMPALAAEWARFLFATGPALAKVLVCDLDNTLWGGVIGEDGLEGIVLGDNEETCPYLRTQRAILNLYDRGIVLAICSKNNPDDALQALERHERMILRPHHFAAMRMNWNDKPANLAEIAAEISVGRDALVFLDDNPVEREHVMQHAPEVRVLDLPDDVQRFADVVRRFPLFERLRLTAEDRERGAMYAQQRCRDELQRSAASVEDYYRSLQMRMQARSVVAETVARASQLTQKTNQYNMTTRRYTEAEIAAFAASDSHRVWTVQVADRFGDNGIVGLLIVEAGPEEWRIDTFLMSCRVIGRTVETAMLAWLAAQARATGAARLVGEFIPTKKNAPAADTFSGHGFVSAGESGDGTRWVFELHRGTMQFPEWIELLESEALPA
ncbi:MAG: HAD-IIIC family phosphatase [Planctomycetia bacterium]